MLKAKLSFQSGLFCAPEIPRFNKYTIATMGRGNLVFSEDYSTVNGH